MRKELQAKKNKIQGKFFKMKNKSKNESRKKETNKKN